MYCARTLTTPSVANVHQANRCKRLVLTTLQLDEIMKPVFDQQNAGQNQNGPNMRLHTNSTAASDPQHVVAP